MQQESLQRTWLDFLAEEWISWQLIVAGTIPVWLRSIPGSTILCIEKNRPDKDVLSLDQVSS